MSNSDMVCPECGTKISFKNIISFEKEVFTIEGIYYVLTCKKCDTTFIPELRTTKEIGPANPKAKKALKELDKMCKKKGFK